MCTPHCPTYSLYQVEAESPRGRISLIQALARQQLQADDKTLDHLNHCLGCRACESVCPSKVPFMALMDKARQLTAKQYSQHPAISKLLNTLERPGGLGNQQSTLNFVKKSGLHQLLQRLPGMPGLSRSATILNHSNIQLFNDLYPAQDAQGSVILFTGCMGSTFNTEAIDSSIRLLTYFGFNVHIPGNQHCCGGLHQHSGHINTAQELAEKNMSLFQSCDAETLIYIDSGC
ncbi:MAG: (Fe-S)-binding protein, partial [Gammaproteobacteria bacterium]|nr:(Fe-S)-binding protein [Gammaproteobacteria bacterium]